MKKTNVLANMKVVGIKILNKKMPKFNFLINLHMLEILKMVNSKAMVLMNGIMELDMMENGKIIDFKVEVKCVILKATFYREYFKIIIWIYKKTFI